MLGTYGQAVLRRRVPACLPADLWRFLQLMAELVGLRHSKYKDALLHMSRRGEQEPDLINW